MQPKNETKNEYMIAPNPMTYRAGEKLLNFGLPSRKENWQGWDLHFLRVNEFLKSRQSYGYKKSQPQSTGNTVGS